MKPVWSRRHTSQGRLLIAPESGKTAIGLDGRQVSGQEGSFSIPGTRCLSPMGPQMSPGCAERETGSPWAPLECADAGHGLVASSSHFQELRSQWRTGRARSFSFSHSFIMETFILEYYTISILILLLPSHPPKPSQTHGLFVIPYIHNIYISYVYIHTYTHMLRMYILYDIYIIYTHTPIREGSSWFLSVFPSEHVCHVQASRRPLVKEQVQPGQTSFKMSRGAEGRK